MTAASITIVDVDTREATGTCNGPASDGSCPRAETNAPVPCAGRAIIPSAARGDPFPYAVPVGETRCPVTVAALLLLAPDTLPDLEG